MKKLFLMAALALGVVSAQAQTVEGSKFTDNWSIGLKGGMTTQMKHSAFFGDARGIAGIEIRKQITPSFGIGAEGEWTVNTSSWFAVKSPTVFDHHYVGMFGAVNLMNLFGGYNGTPRTFEMEAVTGIGWLHAYGHKVEMMEDPNTLGAKVGVNFNFNLGESKAWTIGIKPAIVWNLLSNGNNHGYACQFNANRAVVELMAGVTYHFKNSNGTHSFVLARLYDQNEIDALNQQINGLKADLENCSNNTAALQQKVNNLQNELDACNKKAPIVKEVYKDLNNVHYVFFRLGSSYIQENQKPSIEMTANSLKENANTTVDIIGYASPEGSKAINERLSQRRADAVKNVLVKKYGIDASRISATGAGVGDKFSVPSWNRVAISTVK
ncbi:MAG: OmpA family protein [Muribaculaceae bacterium]|nr:OmpA family protein [Muribaculaceae bacterium]